MEVDPLPDDARMSENDGAPFTGLDQGGVATFAETWKLREAARLAEEQKKKSLAASQERYRMSRALQAGKLGEAIHAAEAVLNYGESLPSDLMRTLVLSSADRPGGKLFAKALLLGGRGNAKFDEHSFATLIGKLFSREAPHAQVRCALNLGLRPDAEVIPLMPSDGREEEKKDAFKNPEKDDCLDAEVSEDEASGRGGPRILEFRSCLVNPKLNGLYQMKPPDLAKLGHSLPIYERRMPGNKGSYFAYFWDAAAAPKFDATYKTGWYIQSKVGFGTIHAQCICRRGLHDIPPSDAKWSVKSSNMEWKADHPSFTKPIREKTVKTPMEEEVERELSLVDLTALRGSVEGKDVRACTYFCHFFVLLTLEHLTELRGFRSRWAFRKPHELVSFGLCFQNMEVDEIIKSREEGKAVPLPGWPNNGGQTVAFKLPRNLTEENCRMKTSESVLISRGDPLKSCIVEGSVQNIDFVDRRLVCSLTGKLPDDPFNRLRFRLDVYANRTTYERQVIALLEFISGKRSQICEMLVAAEVGQVDLAVLGGDGFSSNKDKLGGQADVKQTDQQSEERIVRLREKTRGALDNWSNDDWFAKELEKIARIKGTDLKAMEERKQRVLAFANSDIENLDSEKLKDAITQVASMPSVSTAQKDAIGNSMAKRLTIVQGPPGTGKTHTSVRIMTMWVKTMGYKPLLCTSECNIAVDNIAIGLRRNGVKVVRMGNVAKVREELAGACMRSLIEEKVQKQREDMDEDSEELEDVGEEPSEKDSEEWVEWDRRRQAYRRKKLWIQKQQKWMKQQVIEEAEVIAATTVNSGSAALNGVKFHGILIDEVAQATETSSMVPIVCRGAEQLVLCGDHCQLPPSVQSREAELRGYSLSLYSRLVESGVSFQFLDTQYRAHPMLMEFSASCIYQGKLKSGIDGAGRPSVKGIDWPNKACPAAFFECSVEEHLEGESKANEAEALIVAKLVQQVLDAGELDTDEIGVVTPYKGQVRVLRRTLHKHLNITDQQKKLLEMASVDNFQGREKEIIIFSAVRCNDYGGVGFLKDWRRLNVMITRARRGLVIVGNAKTLCHDIHWRQWLEFTEKQGGVMPGTVEQALKDGEKDAEAKAILKGYSKGSGKGKGKKGKKNGKKSKEGAEEPALKKAKQGS